METKPTRPGQKRTWRTVIVGVCPDFQDLILSEITASNQPDGKVEKE